MIDSAALFTFGLALIFVGVLIMVIAVVLLSISGAKKGKVRGGPFSSGFGMDQMSEMSRRPEILEP